jgi:SAM-dependent methyltransferase
MSDVNPDSVRRVRCFRRRSQPASHEPGPDEVGPHTAALRDTFSRIYGDETWTDKLPDMPRSGRGSLYEHSRSVVQFVEDSIERGDVTSIVDVGCGDLTYMSKIAPVVSGAVAYVGYEIVPELVAEHQRLPWGEFRFGDVTAPGFRADADLVIVKDVLFHLDDEQVGAALANLAASNWRFLLLTSTDNETNEGRTFDRWHFAPLNLLLPSYSLEPSERLERIDGGAFLVLRPGALHKAP